MAGPSIGVPAEGETSGAADGGLSWDRDGLGWPNRSASRFVTAAGLRWHVQVLGQGPVLLLLHGTAASTHSWRDMLPRLAQHFTVVAPDLPGHAFTQMPRASRLSLPGMASAIGHLLRAMDIEPRLAAGHSAGAAILARLRLDRTIAPAGLVSINGALLPIGGVAGQVFSPLAKLVSATPVVPRLVARWASDGTVVRRLIDQTGSSIEPKGLALYRQLTADPRHVAGALAMMARWELQPLVRSLPRLDVPLLLIVGSRDRSIPPSDAIRIRDLVPGATIETLRGLGHLAHEEKPDAVAALIVGHARRCGLDIADAPSPVSS